MFLLSQFAPILAGNQAELVMSRVSHEILAMYVPPAFREDDPAILHRLMRDTRLSTLVTATAAGPIGTPLPLFFDPAEGEHGTLYGHLARANPQW